MKREYPLTLSAIIAMVITLFVSTAIFFSVFSPAIVQLLKDEIKETNAQIAVSASDYLSAKIGEQIYVVRSIEIAHHNIESEGVLFEDNYYQMMMEYSGFMREIEILSPENIVLYSSILDGNREGLNLSNHSLVSQITEPHQLYIGSLSYNAELDQLGLDIVYSGEDVNVLGWVSVEFFSTYGEEFSVSFDDKEIMILDGNGIFLYDSLNNQHLIQNRFVDYDELENIGEDTIMEIDGERSIISVHDMDINDWKIVVYESTAQGLRPSHVTVSYYSITVVFIVLAYIVMFGFFGYIISREIKTLLGNFEDISKGFFGNKLERTRYKEFNRLRDSFTSMSDDLKASQRELEFMAFHDDITELQTKRKAQVDFEKIKNQGQWDFVYLDLDRFSVVNDNYGYKIGDEVLKQVGEFLKTMFNFVYRVEGDEFLALKPKSFGESVEEILVKINENINDYVSVGETGFSLSVKAGVSQYPSDGEDFYDLLQKTIIAVRELEKNRDSIIRYYKQEFSDVHERLAKIEYLVSSALSNNEFTIAYQPIIDVTTKKLRGFECLSRWENEELGFVSPMEFIPILERTSRIHLLDERVLENAVKMNKHLIDTFNSELVVSVNISVETIMRDDFTQKVEDVLKRYRYPAHLLELEITESVFIEDFESINQKMKHLRSNGVKFSEDDFGDAYSSLTYLSRLEIDTLKISKSFLSSLLTNVESRMLVNTILDLSKKLGLRTIVEGIEDEETFKMFEEFGCDYVQGYLFYRPMSDVKIIDLVKEEMRDDS